MSPFHLLNPLHPWSYIFYVLVILVHHSLKWSPVVLFIVCVFCLNSFFPCMWIFGGLEKGPLLILGLQYHWKLMSYDSGSGRNG